LPSGRFERACLPRTNSKQPLLFLGAGFVYVYLIYGMSYMLNLTVEETGVGAGVRLRAFEWLEGIEQTQRRRKTDKLIDLARGPGAARGGIADRPAPG
jgi:DNA-3-methyladenine glycosylase